MQIKAIRFFINSAVVLFLSLATALWIANWVSTGLVQPRDPVLMLSMRTIFWIVGAIGLFVALICLLGESIWWRSAAILWMTVNLLIYHLGFLWSGEHRSFSYYLESLARAFAVPNIAVYSTLAVALVYLLIGSSVTLIWLRQMGGFAFERSLASSALKMGCPGCGVHIRFDLQNLGQIIPCPQCKSAIKLRKPENLKMSCYFCKEHIEFPAHAIGEKLKCPHCERDITLKETAAV